MENISVKATGIVALKEKTTKSGQVTKAPFMGTAYGQPVFTGVQLKVSDTITKANGETAKVWITNLFVKTKDMHIASQLAGLEDKEATLKGWIQTENLAKDENAPANFVSFFYVDEIVDSEEPSY